MNEAKKTTGCITPGADVATRKPARVLYHHRTRGQGVEGVHIRGMVNAFRELGLEVVVCGPAGVALPKAGCGQEEPGSSGVTKGVLAWVAEKAPEIIFEIAELLYNALAFARLLIAVARCRYDLIYERYSLFLLAGVAVARLRRIPIVLEVNDSVTIDRSRHLKLRRIAAQVERWILRHADLVVTVSQPFRQRLLGHGLDKDRVIVTPNAIDPAEWPGQPDSEVERLASDVGRPLTIGCVAAFVEWHRPDLLVKCAADILKATQARLLLVGDGPARPAAEALARELGCGDRVLFTGFLPHDQARARLAEMDIAVMPNSNDHGSPMKIFEYMAAGKAILAPAYPPIREILVDEDTGLLFQPLDAVSMKRQLCRLATDPELRSRLGHRARQVVMRKHTWRHNAEQVLASLSVVLAVGLNAKKTALIGRPDASPGETPPLWTKVSAYPLAENLMAALAELDGFREVGNGFVFRAVRYHEVSRDSIAMERISGSMFRSIFVPSGNFWSGQVSRDEAKKAAALAGRWLAYFHCWKSGGSIEPFDAAARLTAARLNLDGLAGMGLAGQDCRLVWSRLQEESRRGIAEATVTIHGDYKPANLMLTDTEVIGVDMEGYHRGHFLIDVGQFLVHLSLTRTGCLLGVGSPQWWDHLCTEFLRAYQQVEVRDMSGLNFRLLETAVATFAGLSRRHSGLFWLVRGRSLMIKTLRRFAEHPISGADICG